MGTTATANANIVVTVAKTLKCKLTISTYTSATSSAVKWYESEASLNVDGNTETNKNGDWSSFIAYRTGFNSYGQKEATNWA